MVPYRLWLVFVLPMVLPTAACEDNPTIVEVDESLFWLQTIMKAFLAKAMEGITSSRISHSFSHGNKYYGTYS